MPSSPAGMIQKAVSGTATTLARMLKVGRRPKWWMASGAVARLAMIVVRITPATYMSSRQSSPGRPPAGGLPMPVS